MPNVQVTVGGAVHGLITTGQVTRCDEEPTGPLAVAGQVTGYGESDHASPLRAAQNLGPDPGVDRRTGPAEPFGRALTGQTSGWTVQTGRSARPNDPAVQSGKLRRRRPHAHRTLS